MMDSSASKGNKRWRIGRAALAKQVILPPEDWHPLEGGRAPEYIPPHWDGVHVGLRLADAFRTLAQLPGTGGPGALGYWPQYLYEWDDLVAQRGADQATIDEDERSRNRTKLRPTAHAISQMESAISWPGRYITEDGLARTVQQIAYARSRDVDMRHVARKMKFDPKRLRERNSIGLDLIAKGLVRDAVRVY